MLIGLDPLLPGELLALLRDMGHGDRIVLADSNFPAHFLGPPAVRLDTDIVSAGRAILSVFPLDGFVDDPIARMEVDNFKSEVTEAHAAFHAMATEVQGEWPMGSIERFRFYEEAQSCVAIIPTLERRPWANFILTKGVIGPDGKVWRPERKPKPPVKQAPARRR